MSKIKKPLALLLSLLMLMTALPLAAIPAFAEGTAIPEIINTTGDLTGLSIGDPIEYNTDVLVTEPMYLVYDLTCLNADQTSGSFTDALDYEINIAGSGWVNNSTPNEIGEFERAVVYISQEAIDAAGGSVQFYYSARASVYPNVPLKYLGQTYTFTVTGYMPAADDGVDLSMLETGAKIQLGTYASGDNQGNPVEWVIGGDGTTGMSAPEGCIALVSSGLVASDVEFDSSHSKSNVYANSNLKSTVESAVTFSTDEQAAIQSRTLAGNQTNSETCDGVAGDSVTAAVWAPTIKDAYALDNAGLCNVGSNYWLCSLGRRDGAAAFVEEGGNVAWSGTSVDHEYGVRAALYLDLSKVYGTTAVEGKENTYALNLTAPEEETQTHSDHTDWTAIDSADKLAALFANGGKGYLTSDITVSDILTSSNKDITLCLNGYVIDLNGKYMNPIGGSFTLYDCNSTNQTHKFKKAEKGAAQTLDGNGEYAYPCGVITNGGSGAIILGIPGDEETHEYSACTFVMYGGGIIGNINGNESFGTAAGGVYIDKYSSFVMKGGYIAGNYSPYHGGGVYISSYNRTDTPFFMTGGSIINNSISGGNGGGVYIDSETKGYFGGTAVVKDNLCIPENEEEPQRESNVGLNDYGGKMYIADGDNAPVDGMEVGISGYQVNGGKEGDQKYIFADQDPYWNNAFTWVNEEYFSGMMIVEAGAKANGHNYANLADAVLAVKNNGTITLLADAEEGTVTVNRTVTFTIDKGEFTNNATIAAGEGLNLTVNNNTYYIEPHTHAFSKDWSKDETAHWHECTAEGCDIEDYSECVLEAVAYGTHTYVDGVCSVCGFCTHPGFEGNTCTGCGVEFYRPYGVDYTDSAITFKINVLNDEKAEPFLAFGPCVRFDAFLIAGNSGSGIDLDLNFEKNGYYDFCIPVRDKDIFGINENDSGYCVKTGETYDVSIIAAKLNSIKNFSAENPYVWLVLRPCFDNGSMDYGVPDATEFYVSAVCLGKFASLDDLHNLKLTPSHTFDEEWSNDANAHWHACTEENCSIEDYSTCGIDEVAYGEHIGMDDDFTCDTCGYVNAEGQLANAVTEAKAALNTAKTNAKSDEAKAILDGAITALDEAESLDDVNTIKSDALENAEGADDALAEAIATAKENLETAKANAKSDEAKDIIEDALAELDEATNLPAVSYIVEKANADAEEADNALAEAIATAKSDLEAAKTNAKSDGARATITTAINALNNAKSLDDVENIKKEALTSAEEDDNELAGAIATAKADLEAAKTEAVSDEAKAALDKAIENVEKAKNPGDVDFEKSAGIAAAANADKTLADTITTAKANLETAKENATSDEAKTIFDNAIAALDNAKSMEAIETIVEGAEMNAANADKALADAKEEAIEALEAAKEEAVSDEAKAAIDEAIEEIEKATNLEAVAEAKADAEAAAAEADKALADAKEEAIEALEAAKEEAVSDEAKAAIDEAIEEIEKATNPEAVAEEKKDAEAAAAEADKALADAKEEAIEALEAAKEEAVSDEAKAAIDEAIEEIENATNLNDVADEKANGEENAEAADEALAEAIAEAKEALEEEKENAIADDAKEALEAAIEDIDNATSLNEVADKKADAEEAAEAAEKELADAKAEAIKALEEAAGTERSAELKILLKELEDEINSATNPEAAQAPVEEMLEEIEYQKTVDGFELPDEYRLLGYNETTQLHGEAEIGKIVYTSSNPAVATVDENGLVTAVSKGECVITAAVEGTDISDECKIEVKYNFFDILLYYIHQIFSFIKNIFKSVLHGKLWD